MKIAFFRNLPNFKARQAGAQIEDRKCIKNLANQQIKEIQSKSKNIYEAMDAFNSEEVQSRINRLPENDLVSLYSVSIAADRTETIDYPTLSYYPDEDSTPFDTFWELDDFDDLELANCKNYKKAMIDWLDKLLNITNTSVK